MSRVLVTGAGGVIARHLVGALVGYGHEVVSLCRNSRPAEPEGPRHRIAHGDVSRMLPALPPVDWLIHAAAATHLDPAHTATDYARNNVSGTLNMAAYATATGLRGVIHLSTLSVYGRIDTQRLDEQVAPCTPSLYGRTKRLAEEILLDLDGPQDVICLRLPGVTAPGDYRAWIGRALRALLDDAEVRYANGDRPFNNLVDVSELARLLDHLIEDCTPDRRSVVNVAAGEPVALRQLLTAMREAAGSASALVDQGPREPCFTIDTTALERLGFQPESTMAQALRFVRANLPQAGALRPALGMADA